MARLRSPAQRAPQTLAAATELATRFAALDVEVERIEADRNAAIAEANAAADARLVPLVSERDDIAKQLKPWWASNKDQLTAGARKSLELGGCVIGERTSPPAVKAPGKDAEVALSLVGDRIGRLFVRSTPKLDKAAILAALRDGASKRPRIAAALRRFGFTITQREDFFIERAVEGGTLGQAGTAAA